MSITAPPCEPETKHDTNPLPTHQPTETSRTIDDTAKESRVGAKSEDQSETSKDWRLLVRDQADPRVRQLLHSLPPQVSERVGKKLSDALVTHGVAAVADAPGVVQFFHAGTDSGQHRYKVCDPEGVQYGEVSAVFEAVNRCRTDPDGFATTYLVPLLGRFNGRLMTLDTPGGQEDILTEEGALAVREAIMHMRSIGALPSLSVLSAGMCRACGDHVEEVGGAGGSGHTGSDGSSLEDRLGRWGGGLRRGRWGRGGRRGDKVAGGRMRVMVVGVKVVGQVSMQSHPSQQSHEHSPIAALPF